jgi:uncharacterized protein YidB (DUF937 family)
MGLFDELLRNAAGAGAGDAGPQSRGLVEALGAMLQEPEIGGVDGLRRRFEQTGLGPEADSWIGTGQNRSITPDQLTQALGERRVESLASRSGLGRAAGAAAIAAILPALIDKLTPDGRAPRTESLGGLLGGLLGSAFGAGTASAAPAAPARPRADFSNVQSGSSSVATPPQEQWYTVAPGDSLSKIAKRFYSDANQWRKIYDANRDQLQNPDLIHPGQKLKIPTPGPQKSV